MSFLSGWLASLAAAGTGMDEQAGQSGRYQKILRWCFGLWLVLALGYWLYAFILGLLGLPKGSVLSTLEDSTVRVTMLFASAVAGGTPLGGGSVAFPVLTKLLETPVVTGKMFTVFIQSVGMSAAALVILRSGRTLIHWMLLGPVFIISLASLFIFSQPSFQLPGLWVKTLFSVFLIYAVVGHVVSSRTQAVLVSAPGTPRSVSDSSALSDPPRDQRSKWQKHFWIVAAGFAGGLLTAHMGTGADVVLYALGLWLYSRESLTGTAVASPRTILCTRSLIQNSVLLMAALSIVSTLLVLFSFPDDLGLAHGLWLAAVPSVLVGAPVAAWALSTWLSPRILGWALALFALAEWVASLLILPAPYPTLLFVLTLPAGLAFLILARQWKVRSVQGISLKSTSVS